MVTKRDRPPEKGQGSSAAKMWIEDQPDTMDELLAVLGYKVRASDMTVIAKKLEQLEVAMGIDTVHGATHLSETTHYNPADISTWVESMLTELSPSVSETHSSLIHDNHSEYDLRAIPGGAIYGGDSSTSSGSKRMKVSESCVVESGPGPLVVDSQEAGVRLVHTLLACAEAIQVDDLKLADALVKHVSLLSTSQVGSMRKVASYFAHALARKIYKIFPKDSLEVSFLDMYQMHFYESCPYLKFAHFTANQAILEAFAGCNRVHVIDFGLKQGMQWPALLQALALRNGGPPSFRLTGIGPPQPDNTDALQEVGYKLAQLAESIGIEFEFRGFVANSLADIDASMLNIRPREEEAVAVNSVFELHRLLARPGAIEKVLNSIKKMNPKIVTVVEQESNHNSPVFLDRFTQALHYYSTMFDSLETTGFTQTNDTQDLLMSDVYLGRQICNVVSCEGPDRVERHETLTQWRTRMCEAGFDSVHLGSNAYKQASMLLALFAGGDGYQVEENDGSLMLGWHTRSLIATSAWQLVGPV
ncbi:hypothetical protein DCAR_0416765 [Daucus carota subsp. sativus]|uniref:DELLA protein n=1 Tax=Daucus carota subsp. sativus TaxID=79200 RepID=A0A162AAM2_DAUCS|nr:PREDICTED: DELLA protein GAI [Daucus carota subsp. sativus]WOG97425.1 hypothetical protein DCAR_0416765 [Daucus carota subsp. sativus]